MPRPKAGENIYGLVLVDPRWAAVSASGARDGLLFSRGHQGVLSGRPCHIDTVPEECHRGELRMELGVGEKRY